MKNIEIQLRESARVKESMISSCTKSIQKAADIIISSIRKGGKVMWCGNGGSAAQAQHLSTEIIGGLRRHDLPPQPSISLTTDSSMITAWANDVDFDSLFSRQIEGLGNSNDVLVALSTSGNSSNIVKAVKIAESIGMETIIMTGKTGGRLALMGNVKIMIPSEDTQRIQEGHITAGHIFCELVEKAFSLEN
ncbi:MAG: phosphoheptose isomerase [Candidatus Marinimicrobia bacterium]|nr:phosphoheptose isomerase [Candidatus Neomarinimicrobiota bacterium]|tara:strand:+ start:81 stop:656 length:576 start_codon:yes stop_codon:yes gene_type:complete